MDEEQEPQNQRRALLPPGCQFHPSDELLLRYYLTKKNDTGNRERGFYGSNLIGEFDLYEHDPHELPDAACFSYGYGGRKRHWYCFTIRVLKHARNQRRKVKSGFWLRKGRVKDVHGGANVVLGTRTSFVFYVGNSRKNAVRTDWMLYEYALVDCVVASFVLCRVFIKPHQKNSVSEIGLNSWAEESVSAVRHIGIQHDERVSEQEDPQVMTAPVSIATFQFSVDPQGSQQERLSELPTGGGEAMTSQQLFRSILEEDFIELNDLV